MTNGALTISLVRDSIAYSERLILRILDVVIVIILGLLGLRVILRLLAANPGSYFVVWLYQTTGQLLLPFAGMFPSLAFSGVYVLEFSTLFAMLAYSFLGWALMKVISMILSALFRGA
jgi:hypothetical protein